MKPYHLTPKRDAKRALKEEMKARIDGTEWDWMSTPESRRMVYERAKHTPKEQAAVFRKINQIIKFLKGGGR